MSAWKHGLLADQIIKFATAEEGQLFAQLLRHVSAEFQPVGFTEKLLVQQIAICFWKSRRLLRWEARQQREGARIAWAARKLDEEPFGPLLRDTSDGPPEILIGEEMPTAQDLNLIIRYEAANDRRLHRALAHLEALQRERKNAAGASTTTSGEGVHGETQKLPNEATKPFVIKQP